MNLETSDLNIVINCAKTAIKTLASMETLKNKSDFTQEEINVALGKMLDGDVSKKDYVILHSACVFCMEIGGLDSFGLKYGYDDIQQAILRIEELNI